MEKNRISQNILDLKWITRLNIVDNNGVTYKFIYSENGYELVEIDPSAYDYDSYDGYDYDGYDDYDKVVDNYLVEEPTEDIDYLFSEEDNVPFEWEVGDRLDFDEMGKVISDIEDGTLKDWDYY